MRNPQTRNTRTSRQRRKGKIAAQLEFIRSLRGSMKGSGALQFLLAERRRDPSTPLRAGNARGK